MRKRKPKSWRSESGFSNSGGRRVATRGSTGAGRQATLAGYRTYAKELVALQPDVILARTTPATAAVLHESRTIPIVFVGASDPVGAGFAASMARPGGNATGFTNVEASMGGKWVEVLKEINPRIARIAVMFNPNTSPGGGIVLPASGPGCRPIDRGGDDRNPGS